MYSSVRWFICHLISSLFWFSHFVTAACIMQSGLQLICIPFLCSTALAVCHLFSSISCHAHLHHSCYLSPCSVLSLSFLLYSGVLIHFTPHLTLKFKLPLLYNHPTCFHHLILLICHWFVYLIGFFYLSCSFHFKLFDWLSLAFNLNM